MSASLARSLPVMQNAADPSRLQAIHLYRQILRTARSLPSYNHRGVALSSARAQFRANAGLRDPEEVRFALSLADTQLDNLRAQATHMREIMAQTTLTHNAPKPSKLWTPVSSAAPSAPARGFSTGRSLRNVGQSVTYPPSPSPASPFADPSSVSLAAPSIASSALGGGGGWLGLGAEGFGSPSAFGMGAPLSASHIVHVRLSPNNTIATLTTLSGDTRAWASSGTCGFKNAKKSTYMACIACGEQLGAKAKNQNIHNVDLHISGFHKNKKAVLKGLMKAGLNIIAIRDTTPIPFNGCKPKKQRRL